MEFDVLIKHGLVVDGKGKPGYVADVGIYEGKITDIGNLETTETKQIVDAKGQVVSPGFIDIHTHSDVSLLDDPGGESKAFQGVTTEVTGNCSYSPFPVAKKNIKGLQNAFGTTLRSQAPWDWTNLNEWAEAIEKTGVSLNLAPLVGHSALRVSAGVTQDRIPTADELSEMKNLATESLEQGAFGISTGLTLEPSMYAGIRELVSLAKTLSPFTNAFYATHARVWSGWHIKAIEEARSIGQQAGVPVQFSHIAIGDSRVFGQGDQMVEVIDSARSSGLDMTCDVYPYTAGASPLNQSLPSWIQEGGVEGMLAKLRNRRDRRRAFDDMAAGYFRGLSWEWDKMFITYVGSEENANVVGCSLKAISEDRGVDPREVVLSLIDEEDNDVGVVGHNRIESDVRFFMRYEHSMIGSDGNAVSPDGLWKKDMPHPRFYGCYPRVLGRYVREEGVMPLETAIFKMSGLPAQRLGLQNRGRIEIGSIADVVVFNPETILDHADFEKPQQLSTGVTHLFVNGVSVISNGSHTNSRPGRVLRRPA